MLASPAPEETVNPLSHSSASQEGIACDAQVPPVPAITSGQGVFVPPCCSYAFKNFQSHSMRRQEWCEGAAGYACS